MSDLGKVGGKNASLGEMIGGLSQAGVRVPGGFATTAAAFQAFLAAGGLDRRIAERIRLHVAGSPIRVKGGTELLTVTISVGVAATRGPEDTPEALLKRADEGVYESKASGRNKVVSRAA